MKPGLIDWITIIFMFGFVFFMALLLMYEGS